MIDKILSEADDIDWGNTDSVCNFYESQYLFFNNYKNLKDIEDIIEIVHIKARYIESLIDRKHYTKALEIVVHIDFLLEQIKGKTDEYPKLEMENLFHNGLLNSRLKNHKTALYMFQRLVIIDKDNDLYQNWLSHTKLDVRAKYLNIVSYTGLAIVFGSIICRLAFNFEFNRTLQLSGYILMLIGWLTPLIIKYFEGKNKE
tara:strand:- start:1672 stop:2274 length:603 start_codon:yes stop_codon:yes gene_type:complete